MKKLIKWLFSSIVDYIVAGLDKFTFDLNSHNIDKASERLEFLKEEQIRLNKLLKTLKRNEIKRGYNKG